MKRRLFIWFLLVLLFLLTVSCENPSTNEQNVNTTNETPSTVDDTSTAELPDSPAVDEEGSESETTKKNDSGVVWTPFF